MESDRAAGWFKKYREILKTKPGGVNKVVRSIRYYNNSLKIRSGKRSETIREGMRYFTRNRSRMKYAEYRRKGLPIGNGVVEAGCKTLVEHRLKKPGMRWSIDGGQNILNLRAIVLSQRWDHFWRARQRSLEAAALSG